MEFRYAWAVTAITLLVPGLHALGPSSPAVMSRKGNQPAYATAMPAATSIVTSASDRSIRLHNTKLAPQVDDITPAAPDVLQSSLLAARLAQLAYPDTFLPSTAADTNTQPAADQQYKKLLTTRLNSMGLTAVGFVDRYSIFLVGLMARFLHAYIAAAPATADKEAAVYVVFRGTDASSAAVATDMESRQTSLPGSTGVMVHEGFYASLTEKPGYIYNSQPVATSAYEDIQVHINAALALPGVGPAASIILIGHSLGGAEAALCAYQLRVQDGFSNITLFTFGAPQVGNKAWRDAFDEYLGAAHFRWWNMKDRVAQVPNSKIDPGSIFSRQSWFTTETLYRIEMVGGMLKCGIPSGVYAVCDDRGSATAPTNRESCYTDVSIEAAVDSADHKLTAYEVNLMQCMKGASSVQGVLLGFTQAGAVIVLFVLLYRCYALFSSHHRMFVASLGTTSA